MLDNKSKIPLETYINFCSYLESIKGLEEDAKKFLFMANSTEIYQFDYHLIRQFTRRTIAQKPQQDILKFFEQARKLLKVNEKVPDSTVTETELKEAFYDGFLADLI